MIIPPEILGTAFVVLALLLIGLVSQPYWDSLDDAREARKRGKQ